MFKLKKLVISSTVLVLLLGLWTGFAWAEGSKTGVVTAATGLKMRSGPGTTYDSMGSLPKDTKVTILSSTANWYKAKTAGGSVGWFIKTYIAIKSTSATSTAVQTTSAAANKTGVVTASSSLNMRSGPGTSYDKAGSLPKGTNVAILSSTSNWYKVKTAGGSIGWVIKDYVAIKSNTSTTTAKTTSTAVSSKPGVVSASSGLNLRSGPGTSYKVVDSLSEGAGVIIVSSTSDWYKVKASDGTTGWGYKKYIVAKSTTIAKKLVTVSRSEERASLGEEMVSYARKFLGVDYVWGGATPNGFDCSGFVLYVNAHFGITLNRVAADQATQGTRIDKDNLKPGDLVFFDTNGGHNYINHVGMYIGGGNFIHASSGHGYVMVTDLTSGYYADAYMTARRIR